MQRVEATVSVSVSDLKKSPSAVMDVAEGEPVAVLNHNRVMAYLVPADLYEAMLDRLDDQYLVDIAKARSDEQGEPVDIDEL